MGGMAWIRTIPVDELPPGTMTPWEVAGRDLLLCNHEGDVRAVDGMCPHVNGPLAQGNFSDGRVVCPWHAWEFDTATGACVHNDRVALARYGVEVRDGVVCVELPDGDA